jgi:hypothetical protein
MRTDRRIASGRWLSAEAEYKRGFKPGIDKNAVGTDRSARVAVAKV